MKVKINGKIFKAHGKEDSHFEIRKGVDTFDLMFFKDWFFKTINTTKKMDYVIDIPFVSKLGYGQILSCFPVEITEDMRVEFIYEKEILQSTI